MPTFKDNTSTRFNHVLEFWVCVGGVVRRWDVWGFESEAAPRLRAEWDASDS